MQSATATQLICTQFMNSTPILSASWIVQLRYGCGSCLDVFPIDLSCLLTPSATLNLPAVDKQSARDDSSQHWHLSVVKKHTTAAILQC